MLLPSENVGDGIKKFFEGTFHNSQLSPFETSWSSAHPFNEVTPQDDNQYQSNGSNGCLDDCKSDDADPNQSDDVCESETYGLSTIGEGSDSECYYEYISENEKAANIYPAIISDDEMVLESAIPDENEISLNLTDLAGDYDNHMRNLLFGLDYHRFMSHWEDGTKWRESFGNNG